MTNDGLNIVGAKRSEGDREKNDYYKTCPFGTKSLLKKEDIQGVVLEPACGDGAISKILEKQDSVDKVISLDIVDRGYGKKQDYFSYEPKEDIDCIVTNPPYKKALEFVKKALNDVKDGGKVCMLLKLVFLESEVRYDFFKNNPPNNIYVFSKRLDIWKSGEVGKNSGLVCYAWFVWNKGNTNLPKVDWICEGREGILDDGQTTLNEVE